MEENKVLRYQVVDSNSLINDEIIPVEWTNFSLDIIYEIPSKFIYNQFAITSEGDLVVRSFVNLKLVDKFKDGMKIFKEKDNIQIGFF